MAKYHDMIVATPGLSAYWKLGEASGSVIADYSGNHLDLTISSATLGQASIVTNEPGNSADFNGTTNFAYLPGVAPASLQGGSAITVECWYQPDALGNRAIVSLFGDATHKGYWINGAANPTFWISTNGSAQDTTPSGPAMTVGQTYHLVGTYDGETINFYMNGVLAGTNTAPSGAIFNVATPANAFAIGRLGALASDYADGRIDEVAVYKRVLTAAEINSHYKTGRLALVPATAQVIRGRRGAAKITPYLYLSDKDNNWNTDISKAMQAGTVEMRLDRRIKMAFQGTIKNPEIIRPFIDYLAPVMKIEYSDGSVVTEQLGLFSTVPLGSESSYYSSTGQFTALDLGWNLSETTFGDYKTVAAGANVVDTVVAILNADGYARVSIPGSAKTFPKTRTYDITRDKWNVCNAMLSSINYYHMWVDRQGVITSLPYIDYDQTQLAKTLAIGPTSDLIGLIKKEPLTDSIYNKVRVIGERPKTNTPIIQTLINSNPLSPTSTVSLGRVRQRRPDIKDTDINDSATALEVARRAMQESSSLYTRYTLQTLPDPARNFFEVYGAELSRIDGVPIMSGRYRVSGWKIALDHRTPMEHYLNRLEAYQ